MLVVGTCNGGNAVRSAVARAVAVAVPNGDRVGTCNGGDAARLLGVRAVAVLARDGNLSRSCDGGKAARQNIHVGDFNNHVAKQFWWTGWPQHSVAILGRPSRQMTHTDVAAICSRCVRIILAVLSASACTVRVAATSSATVAAFSSNCATITFSCWNSWGVEGMNDGGNG